MKVNLRRVSSTLIFIFLAAVILTGAYYWEVRVPKSCDISVFGVRLVGEEGEWKEFNVKKGESVSEIAQRLKTEGVIRSPFFFRIYARLNNLDKTVKFGRYWVSPSLSVVDLAARFQQNKEGIRLTLLEGRRREEFAAVAARAVGSVDFEDEFLKASSGLEGYLFPDTYIISASTSAADLVSLLHNTFLAKYQSVVDAARAAVSKTGLVYCPNKDSGSPRCFVCLDVSSGVCQGKRELSQKDLVTIASLVERETASGDKDELRTIAGIIIKRWLSGWKLDIDATVQYALGFQGEGNTWWKKVLTSADKEVISPFNTYRNKGLPPAPICDPGLAAMEAVRNAKPSPYWFYLHDKNGNVHFAKTIEEQILNASRYLR
jgi:UPF0755 protein